ncbi:intestinal mucin-like protein [Discoglossus pictus]
MANQCCGICEIDSCIMTMEDNVTVILQPGETRNSTIDKCSYYTCNKSGEHFVTVSISKGCTVYSADDCSPGYTYKKLDNECCGSCTPVTCPVKMPDNSITLLKPGEIYISPSNNCTSYTCSDNYQLVTVQKTCQDFDPSKCVEGTIKMSGDGCCKTCEVIESGCRINKKSTRITTSNCESDQTVELSYCEGACQTSSIYSAEASTMEHTCSCCQEMKTSKREVTLKCRDGTSSLYSYIYVDQCGCTNTECGQEPQTSDSQQHEE